MTVSQYLFISDFKFDLNPSFERAFDVQKMEDVFGTAEKRYAFLDRTNILNPGKTTSESELVQSFDKLFSVKGRVFLTMFSSNIYRLKNIIETATRNGRKISTIGRSISNYLAAGDAAGLINLADYKIVEFDSVQNYQFRRHALYCDRFTRRAPWCN